MTKIIIQGETENLGLESLNYRKNSKGIFGNLTYLQ